MIEKENKIVIRYTQINKYDICDIYIYVCLFNIFILIYFKIYSNIERIINSYVKRCWKEKEDINK